MKHWLMKTEPDGFGIDDLERVKVEPWTGVRNYMARNLMRDQMQVGDRVLFYHSSADPSGVAGLATIVRTGVVDATQFEPTSKYYDPDSPSGEPRWICVDVEFVEKLPRLVALGELRAEPALDGMMLLQKGSRLSVQPVSEAHYDVIVAIARQPAPEESPKRKAKPAPKAKAKPAPKAKASSKKKAAPKRKPPAKPKKKAQKRK
jgi:predicted RNA-binding protein with PUA-like domain